MSISAEQGYLQLLNQVLQEGEVRTDRTGVGTRGIFGAQVRYSLKDSFPLFTTKQVHFKSVAWELLWFLSGRTDNQWLQEHGVRIWNEWATKEQCAKFGREEGDLGPVYGFLWRHFGENYAGPKGSPYLSLEPEGHYRTAGEIQYHGIDQIARLIKEIKTNPQSRRLIVTGWDPRVATQVALPPCHTLFQFYVQEDRLSCQLYQRSADLFLGVPFNVASYALLTYIVANICGLKPHEFVHTMGDAHIYTNHVEQVKLQLQRTPYAPPKLEMTRQLTSIDDLKFEDFKLVDYQHHPKITATVAV